MTRAMIVAACLLLPFASALILESNTWGPSDSVKALDGVITAVNKIVNNSHLSGETLTKAKKVAEDIKLDIEAVEAGNLTKQQTKEKVGGAIKELQTFAAQAFSPAANDDKLNMLMKKLAEKKKALAKVEGMMKLLKLKKALAEKKLMLEKLIMKKSEAAGGHKAEQDMAETSAAVSKLLIMAKNVTGVVKAKAGAKDELPTPLKAIASSLQEREKVVSDSLAKIVSMQSKGEAQIDAILKTQMADVAGKTEFDEKKKKMFKHLKTQESRKFAKARALRQNELNELKDAEKSTEERDVPGLVNVLSKMQRESRQLQAKSGDFLH